MGPYAQPWLFYEEKLTSMDALVKAVRALDEDSGIRLLGEREGKKCILFVTRFGRKYTVMTYGLRGKTEAPGKRLDAVEVEGAEAAARVLGSAVTKRIRAYVY